jgi:hypothetical protein
MAPKKAQALAHQTAEISRHPELIQPRRTTASTKPMPIAEREKIREKIKVNAAKRPGAVKPKRSALVPAEGGGMGMGMSGGVGGMDVD